MHVPHSNAASRYKIDLRRVSTLEMNTTQCCLHQLQRTTAKPDCLDILASIARGAHFVRAGFLDGVYHRGKDLSPHSTFRNSNEVFRNFASLVL